MKIFAMYDRQAQNYPMPPFAESSTVAALRGFDVAVNKGESIFSRFPDDFELHELATFDSSTGHIIPTPEPANLGTARTVLKTQPQQNSLAFPQNANQPI